VPRCLQDSTGSSLHARRTPPLVQAAQDGNRPLTTPVHGPPRPAGRSVADGQVSCHRRTRTADGAATKVERREGRLWSVANVGARAILAPYLTIVGLVRNKRLLRDGNSTARFRTVIEHGFFAYESEKYERLRATYKEAFESP